MPILIVIRGSVSALPPIPPISRPRVVTHPRRLHDRMLARVRPRSLSQSTRDQLNRSIVEVVRLHAGAPSGGGGYRGERQDAPLDVLRPLANLFVHARGYHFKDPDRLAHVL